MPHILALDSDQWQTRGSQIWEQRVARALRTAGNDNLSTPIFHKTIHITPDTLIPAVDDWIRETKEGTNHNDPDHVLFVALHACGSLTPDIFRACVSAACRRNSSWIMAGAVIVGCCYNLLTPTGRYYTCAYNIKLTKLKTFHFPRRSKHRSLRLHHTRHPSAYPPLLSILRRKYHRNGSCPQKQPLLFLCPFVKLFGGHF